MLCIQYVAVFVGGLACKKYILYVAFSGAEAGAGGGPDAVLLFVFVSSPRSRGQLETNQFVWSLFLVIRPLLPPSPFPLVAVWTRVGILRRPRTRPPGPAGFLGGPCHRESGARALRPPRLPHPRRGQIYVDRAGRR